MSLSQPINSVLPPVGCKPPPGGDLFTNLDPTLVEPTNRDGLGPLGVMIKQTADEIVRLLSTQNKSESRILLRGHRS
jgi:hypothetical protein